LNISLWDCRYFWSARERIVRQELLCRAHRCTHCYARKGNP
jgi:hypothetical protein